MVSDIGWEDIIITSCVVATTRRFLRTQSRHEKRRLYVVKKRNVETETDTIEAWKTSLIRRQKRDTSWRKRTGSRREKRRLYAVKNATRRDENGQDRGTKNVAYTPSKYAVKNATRRDGNGHDRGMKNVGDTSSKKRHVVTRRHVEKNNFWTDDVDEL